MAHSVRYLKFGCWPSSQIARYVSITKADRLKVLSDVMATMRGFFFNVLQVINIVITILQMENKIGFKQNEM